MALLLVLADTVSVVALREWVEVLYRELDLRSLGGEVAAHRDHLVVWAETWRCR
jgi:hypothetical protein